MSRSSARSLGVAVLLVGVLCAMLLGRDAAGVAADGELLSPAAGAAGQAFTAATTPADSAEPAKPRRQVVPDVEVVVNIPSGRLELMDGGSVVASYPVSVGSARYPTPVGTYLLATVIWNPWWNPPPESEWARDRKPTPPGPGNPMGRVKLHMDELIYIHGTTSEGRLGAPASHGCIRMSNPDVVDLAKRLARYAEPGVGDAELERLSRAGREERYTVMPRSIRMRVTYDVAQLRGDALHVFPDVYGRGGSTALIRRELARGGMDTAAVPDPAMARLRQGAVRGGATFALAEIPLLQPLPPETPRPRGPRVLGRPVSAPRASADTIVLGTVSEPVPAPEPAPPPADTVTFDGADEQP